MAGGGVIDNGISIHRNTESLLIFIVLTCKSIFVPFPEGLRRASFSYEPWWPRVSSLDAPSRNFRPDPGFCRHDAPSQ